jgi:prepilin-type N-terminal cleavage/methylation domain-containing protein/prepilin-type processing-associated H-X9-DG protein
MAPSKTSTLDASGFAKTDGMSRKRAFTLIELLVVIAIIAILAAILFPVFAQAKNAAKKSASISNMRQVGMATMLYLQDSDDVMMPLYYFDTNNLSIPSTQGFYYWPVLLLQYTKNENIFLCPNDRDDDPILRDSQGRGRFDPENSLHYYIMGANPSYGYNYRYLNTQINSPDPNGSNPTPFYFVGNGATNINAPASTVLFGESTMKDRSRPGGGTITSTIGYSRIEPPSRWTGVYPNAAAYGQLWPRFNNKLVNITYLDGHAKATSILSLKKPGTTPDEVDAMWNGKSF